MSAVFGLTGKLSTGIGASWVRQSSNPSTTVQRAQALGATGQEVAKNLYDSTDSVTETWMAKDDEDLEIPEIGDKVNDYILTSISIATSNTGFVVLSITGHKHTDDDPIYTADTGFTALITSIFGALELSGGSGVLNSSSIEATLQHAEVKGSDGNNVVGENYNCMLTVTETFIDAGALGTGWDVINTSTNETNTGYQMKTITGTKKLELT
jgi:hypothetical protein